MAENHWKMRGMKKEEMMDPGEPQIPHQLWKKSVCVCQSERERATSKFLQTKKSTLTLFTTWFSRSFV